VSLVLFALAKGPWPFASIENPKIYGANSSEYEAIQPKTQVMNLKLATPTSILFEGEILSLTAPGTLGYFQILENHAPFLTTLTAGTVTLLTPTTTLTYSITGGVLECAYNQISLLADNRHLA
jgi:F-type H+-transporting ATPase subunit epsilon